MNIDYAIRFVVDEVEDPALQHPLLEDDFKRKVTRSKIIVHRMKKIGDLKKYLQRFEVVPPPGDDKRKLYDRFKALGLKTYEDLYSEFEEKFKDYSEDVTVLGDFVLGKEYSSWDISIFAQTYDTQSGIYLIGNYPNYQAIFIKATFEKGKYPNKWIEKNNILKYYMYSLKGVFNPDYKYNSAIINSVKTNTPIYMFVKQDTRLTLNGIYYYESHHEEPSDGSKWFILKKINSLHTNNTLTLSEYDEEILKQVRNSRTNTKTERQKRLDEASKVPETVTVVTTAFKRNPDVIIEVLDRARGICEKCKKPAPFIRASDLTPYLEVHHKIPLAIGGEDIVDNAIALCPNCHREEHYAAAVINVTAAIMIEDGKVLITKRGVTEKSTGKWTFPGGKKEPKEPNEKCLRRVLKEELGINVSVGKYFGECIYNNSSGTIRLMAYVVKRFAGEIHTLEDTEVLFVKINELDKYQFVLSDAPIVEMLKSRIIKK